MVLKIINATEARVGTNLTLEGEFYTVKKMDVSKTGKHGHAKCRIEAISVLDGKKKVFVVGGHERLEVPMIEKRSAQVLSMQGNNANVMDSETYETFDLEIPEELRGQVLEGVNVVYWVILNDKVMKQIKGGQ